MDLKQHVLVYALTWDALQSQTAVFLKTLSVSEQDQASRFTNLAYRRQFILTRGVLRHVLSRSLAKDPHEIALGHQVQGKPYVLEDPTLYFNLSHSHERLLIALTRKAEVGVDIQVHRPVKKYLRIAQRFFHPKEYQALMAQPVGHQVRLFFDLWSLKEAYLKAYGYGIRDNMKQCHTKIHQCQVDLYQNQKDMFHLLDLGADISAYVYLRAPVSPAISFSLLRSL